jgi:hypothetical protein
MAKRVTRLDEVHTKVLKTKVRHAKKRIGQIKKDLRTLIRQSDQGTLHRKMLVSGINKVMSVIDGIPDHFPHRHGP